MSYIQKYQIWLQFLIFKQLHIYLKLAKIMAHFYLKRVSKNFDLT